MLSLIFWIMMLLIFGNVLMFAIKAAWGISKVICTVVLLPLVLVVMVLAGLIKLVFPILAVIGLISFFSLHWD